MEKSYKRDKFLPERPPNMPDFDFRRRNLIRRLAEEGLDGALITNPLNVTYLTGFTGEASTLVVGSEKVLLVSDGRFTEQIAEECPGLDVYIRPPSITVQQATQQELAKMGFRSVGFEAAQMTVADFEGLKEKTPSVEWKPGRDRVEQLRAIKDNDEVGAIRLAIKIAEKAFAMFRAMLRPTDTEKDLADAMEGFVRRAGGKCTSFPVIAATGARAALPHAPPTNHRVEESFLLLVDWGANESLYKSDLTRVLWSHNHAAASPSDYDQFRRVYEVVLEAQRRAIATIRPGVTSTEVDKAARGYIADQGFGERFTHGLGHGIGLNIHEAPFFRPNHEVLLEAGMVVTMEPGIYLPGWGGVRIEDDVLITPDGAEVLTNSPRDLDANVWER